MTNTRYYRIRLGKEYKYVNFCEKEGLIGVDFGLHQDVSNDFCDNWKELNKKLIPVLRKERPDKNTRSAGLSCGAIWTFGRGLKNGDIVLSPKGDGHCLVGEITGDYFYMHNKELPHRRNIKWYSKTISYNDMTDALLRRVQNPGTVREFSKDFYEELKMLISGDKPSPIVSNDESIENPSHFALEKHLEDFLVENWNSTMFGKKYNIYGDEEKQGQQFPTDTGPMDILAISKDEKEFLVIELKKGRASDSVVGQIQRYMGFVKEQMADNQKVKGAIIALENDLCIRRALSVTSDIKFYRYKIKFDLEES